MWSQTDGSTQVDFNSNMAGVANSISSGNDNIGKTLTSFTLELKYVGSTTSLTFYFGVWASGNNVESSPTAVFTGSISNYNQLTTNFTVYTFSGSRVLVEGDHIGFCFNGDASNTKVKRANGLGEVTIDDVTMTARADSNPDWWNYNPAQVLNQQGYQTC